MSSKLAIYLSMTTALMAPAAVAQSDDPTGQMDSFGADEIIVTATRRAESIQDVPISISAYGEAFIEESGIQDIRDVSLYSPNFTISNSSQLSNNRIAIRGVGSVGNAGIEPSVGVFIDGVYYPRPGSVIGNLLDVNTVEVLRGPQGTLFGRNTPMGALNIRTNDPSLSDVGGEVELGYGNYNAINLGATTNLPVSDTVALRLAGKYTERDGFGENLLTGDDFGARDDLTFRAKLLWEPADNFSVKLSGDFQDINSEGQTIEYLNSADSPQLRGTLNALIGFDPGLAGISGLELLTDDPFDHEVYQEHEDVLNDTQYGFSGEVAYETGSGFEIKSITAARWWEADYFESAIRLPISLFPRVTDYENTTISQEVQLLSPKGERFDYLVGAFYYKEDYFISQDFNLGSEFCTPVVFGVLFQQLFPAALAGVGPFAGVGPAPSPAVAQQRAAAAATTQAGGCDAAQQIRASDSTFQQDLESLAVFGQGTYRFNDQFSITLGGRYTSDDKKADFSNVINNPFVIGLAVRDNEVQSGLNIDEFGFDTDQFTYFANLSWQPNPDMLVFATTSTGYKSGGFNTDGTFPALTRAQRIFGPEDTTNYEVGIKSTLLNGDLQLNATAFRMDIEGFQDRAFDGISFITRNVGELRQQGVEVDATWRPLDQLMLIGGASYLDSEFRDYRNASPLPGGPIQDLTGARAHFAPKWQGSLVADWSDDFGDFAGGTKYFLRGEGQYIGDQNIGGNTNQNPQSEQDGYGLLNARLGLRADDGQWQFSLYGKNLTDEGYCLTIFDQPFSAQLGGVDPVANTNPQRCAVGTPRTYGAELRFTY